MEALWRRLVFIILISNTDDHLRNHGFLYEGSSGSAAVARLRSQSSPGGHQAARPHDRDQRGRHDGVAAGGDRYGQLLWVSGEDARAIAAEVGAAVARWRDEAETFGLTKSQADRMASAFEHEDLALALKA